MKELEDRIRQDGIVREGNVLKVDSFLNHKCDVALYDQMGAEWARLFEGKKVDKILTIESSGIGIACVAATHFHNAPVVFARKTESKNLDGEQYRTQIKSYTKGRTYEVSVATRVLERGEHRLVRIGRKLSRVRAAAKLQDVGHTVDQDRRFPAAGAREQKQRAFRRQNIFALFRVQIGIFFFNDLPPRGGKPVGKVLGHGEISSVS